MAENPLVKQARKRTQRLAKKQKKAALKPIKPNFEQIAKDRAVQERAARTSQRVSTATARGGALPSSPRAIPLGKPMPLANPPMVVPQPKPVPINTLPVPTGQGTPLQQGYNTPDARSPGRTTRGPGLSYPEGAPTQTLKPGPGQAGGMTPRLALPAPEAAAKVPLKTRLAGALKKAPGKALAALSSVPMQALTAMPMLADTAITAGQMTMTPVMKGQMNRQDESRRRLGALPPMSPEGQQASAQHFLSGGGSQHQFWGGSGATARDFGENAPISTTAHRYPDAPDAFGALPPRQGGGDPWLKQRMLDQPGFSQIYGKPGAGGTRAGQGIYTNLLEEGSPKGAIGALHRSVGQGEVGGGGIDSLDGGVIFTDADGNQSNTTDAWIRNRIADTEHKMTMARMRKEIERSKGGLSGIEGKTYSIGRDYKPGGGLGGLAGMSFMGGQRKAQNEEMKFQQASRVEDETLRIASERNMIADQRNQQTAQPSGADIKNQTEAIMMQEIFSGGPNANNAAKALGIKPPKDEAQKNRLDAAMKLVEIERTRNPEAMSTPLDQLLMQAYSLIDQQQAIPGAI